MYACKFCGREFETGRQLGGHIVLCPKNPNYNVTQQKIRDKKPKKERMEFICEVCGNPYFLDIYQSEYKRGKFRKTCSTTCSHKLASINTNKTEKNLNIKNAFSEKEYVSKKIRVDRFCERCGKIISETRNSKYCSDRCKNASRKEKLSKQAKERKLGGLTPNQTHKYYKRGFYKGIWCDSSWELAFLIYMFDHKVEVVRNYDHRNYIFDGQVCRFYPDFKINDQLYEIKGFYTPRNIAKKEQVKDVIFLDYESLKEIFDYVKTKYGKDFIELYDTRV